MIYLCTMKQILRDRLLVERIKVENKNSILDIIEDGNGPLTGLVHKVGKQVEDVKEQDRVLYKESDSLSITLEGKNFHILREYDIIGII